MREEKKEDEGEKGAGQIDPNIDMAMRSWWPGGLCALRRPAGGY